MTINECIDRLNSINEKIDRNLYLSLVLYLTQLRDIIDNMEDDLK